MTAGEDLLRRAFLVDDLALTERQAACEHGDLRLMRREQDRPLGHKQWCQCPVCKALGLRP